MPTSSDNPNVILITGASSGIGAALARELAAQGAWLALGARRVDELEAVASQCRERGGRALAIACDVSDQAQCRAFVEAAVAEYGRVDTLINNAGISMWARFADLENPDLIARIMAVNFFGAVYCTYYALPYLRQTRGRIACISSMADKIVAPGSTGYVASKHALEGFFESLRPEVAADGISITMLYPGFVDTGLAGRMLDAKGQSSRGITDLLHNTRQATPEATAQWILAATQQRKRAALQAVSGVPGWLVPWVRLLAPRLLERIGRDFMARGGL